MKLFLYFIIFILVLLVGFIVIYNLFRKRKNQVNEAFATMDVYLKKRWDLIPNLVEAVKGYANYEKSTLVEIIKKRSNYDTLDNDEKIKSNVKINVEVTKLLAVSESYPELKADKSFLELQKSLSKIETEIADSRRYYNAMVRLYNNLVDLFPTNVVALLCGYKDLPMFAATEDEKKNIEVDLNEKA